MRTREETEEAVRAHVQKVPTRLAENIFTDKDFQRTMNAWMLQTHIFWGVSLAVTFIGLNYLMIWSTEVFHIAPWVIALTLTPLGLGFTIQQWFKYRVKKPKNSENHQTQGSVSQ